MMSGFSAWVIVFLLCVVGPVVCKRNVKVLEGHHEDLVTGLPGQPHVDFNHFAGYVTVDEENGKALFYWFYEAQTQPDNKPLVLWLNGALRATEEPLYKHRKNLQFNHLMGQPGIFSWLDGPYSLLSQFEIKGPGCSSVGYGATQELGPFLVNLDGHGLTSNPYSWNKEANMLFLESPVGVGFSYSNTTSDYSLHNDEITANDTYNFLQNWFRKFPSYRNREFYITGESYAGMYVPELAELIYDRNNNPNLHINLKGFMVGNAETSNGDDWKGQMDYAWSHAIISDETYKIIKANCDFYRNDTFENKTCSDAVDEVFNQYDTIDIYSLYTSVCLQPKKLMIKRTPNMMPRIMGGGYDPCLDNSAKIFYNIPQVQKALHAGDGILLRNWSICNDTLFDKYTYTRTSVLPIYKKLIAAGLRIWVFSGDTDGRVPVLSTRYWLDALELPITKQWTPWYHQKQVSGWIQEYKGLTFATFRGAGHTVPSFKPSESLAFFGSFLAGVSPLMQR